MQDSAVEHRMREQGVLGCSFKLICTQDEPEGCITLRNQSPPFQVLWRYPQAQRYSYKGMSRGNGHHQPVADIETSFKLLGQLSTEIEGIMVQHSTWRSPAYCA